MDINNNTEILNPNCSEWVTRICIKKSELPYIKKRIKDLGYDDGSDLLEEFTDYFDKQDVIDEMMSEDIAGDYETIRDEVLAKRVSSICPFCKIKVKDFKLHIKKYHKEEVVSVWDNIKKEEVDKMRKEIVYNNL